MKHNLKTSFVIFIIALVITALVFTIAALYPFFGWDKKNLIFLGFSQFMVAVITPIGILSGYKTKNKIGLWGNTVLFIFTIGIAIYALLL